MQSVQPNGWRAAHQILVLTLVRLLVSTTVFSADYPDDCLPGDTDGNDSLSCYFDAIGMCSTFCMGQPPTGNPCANVDGDCDIDPLDVAYMIEYCFYGGPPPLPPGCLDPVTLQDADDPDTVKFAPDGLEVPVGDPFSIPIWVWHDEEMVKIVFDQLFMEYVTGTGVLSCDSVTYQGTRLQNSNPLSNRLFVPQGFESDSGGILGLSMIAQTRADSLARGGGNVATVWFTALSEGEVVMSIIPNILELEGSILAFPFSGYRPPNYNLFSCYMPILQMGTIQCTAYPEPVAHWCLDEGEGSQASDCSGNGWDGTVYGAAWGPGSTGQALEFSGTDEVGGISMDLDNTVSDGFTIMAGLYWYGSTGVQCYIFDARNHAVDGGFIFYLGATGRPVLKVDAPAGDQSMTADYPILSDCWTHLAGVYDATAQKLRVFMYGHSTDSADITTPYYDNNTLAIAIGNNAFHGEDRPFNGVIDEVRFFDRALSEAEIAMYVEEQAGRDSDVDGIVDACDNCPYDPNPDQSDTGIPPGRTDNGIGDECDCCSLRVGDANGLGGDEPTIGDISVMIDAKFITGSCEGILECFAEADINQSGGLYPTCDDITIGDISTLIDYLFITGPSLYLPDCL